MTIQLVYNVINLIRIGKGLRKFQTFEFLKNCSQWVYECCNVKPIGNSALSIWVGVRDIPHNSEYIVHSGPLSRNVLNTSYKVKWLSRNIYTGGRRWGEMNILET